METTQNVSETVIIHASEKLIAAVKAAVNAEAKLEGALWKVGDALRAQVIAEKLDKKQATAVIFEAYEEAGGKAEATIVSKILRTSGAFGNDEEKAKIEAAKAAGIGFNTTLAIVRNPDISKEDIEAGKAVEKVKAAKAERNPGGQTAQIAATPTPTPENGKPENPQAWLRTQFLSLFTKARAYGLDEAQIQACFNEARQLK